MDNESLPVQDDIQPVDSGQTEQDLLDAVMRNSPIMGEVAPPLPTEEELEADPAESELEDPESEEVEEDYEEVEDTEEEEVEGEDVPESEDEGTTQDPEVYSLDELEEFKVTIKIDGEEQAVDINELVKGYSTDASLSKKGRELGEARKALEEERDAKLQELEGMAQATGAVLHQAENAYAMQFTTLTGGIDLLLEIVVLFSICVLSLMKYGTSSLSHAFQFLEFCITLFF